MSSAGHEWVPHEREGWSVCSRCGVVRNYYRETTCSGALPKIRQRGEIEAFLRRTAIAGGSIVSSAAMTSQQLAIARAAGRMLVMPDGYGFVYVPGPRFCACGRPDSDCDQSRASCPRTDNTSEDDESDIAPLRRENEVLRSNSDHLSSENASLASQVESMAMRIESLAEELAKPEDVRLREVLDALDGRFPIFDSIASRVSAALDEAEEFIRRAGEAERMIEAARRSLSSVVESMTEHAYQELASALESPPRIAGKTADFDPPGREYTAGDALGLRRDR